jgi:glycosyltransferase involved in cell wall biosynthesis
MKPLVTIIIPTYNRANLLAETLDSIRVQDYENWECIVVDDGSEDSTKELVEKYCQGDGRFRYYDRPINKPKGANACRNYGFELSKGKYINWFDSDDLMYPEKLKIQVINLENSEYPFCVCQAEWFDAISNISKGDRAPLISNSENILDDYITKKIFWTTGATLWRSEFLRKNKMTFDESLHQSQEFGFNIKALAISPVFIAVTEPLFQLIMHDNNVSNNIFSNYEKITSHVRVRSMIIKNFHGQISSSTVESLYRHIFNCYSVCLKSRKIKSSSYVFFHLVKSVNKIKRNNTERIKFLLRMLIVLITVPLFYRGQKLIKFL